MSIKLKLAQCNQCKGYRSSTVVNPKDIHHPEVVDHYFYHGEPWFTFNSETFEKSVNYSDITVKVVDLKDHFQNDLCYCTCQHVTAKNKDFFYYTIPGKGQVKTIDFIEDFENDIYFRDLYIIYNNYHQDIPKRQAI
ncbi:hypothetical protein [Epilithonimonas arachidiradicis]|uniref:Uncharacterized protein n=1 Tax=Epilithonimonas arachidiradicis TaxID=1617282 RepID=A0A420DBN0_9FLAO|nr:hypothetical protein [Epilithonimonas arachidiradicis]RKE88369.1 hypothetical protein BXY58_1519 [Epilithonimonas arachidiradicis]GGG49426.1 hypothetical protein GCM10007332_08690 [Epilithonimonas arachidiradicis]